MFIYWASRIVIGALAFCLALSLPYLYSGIGGEDQLGLVMLPLLLLSPFAVVGVLVSTKQATKVVRILKRMTWIALGIVVVPVILLFVVIALFPSPEFSVGGFVLMPLVLIGLPVVVLSVLGIILAEVFALYRSSNNIH